MKQFEKRLRALETAAGIKEDNSFLAQVGRAHAQGERIPVITVQPGETVKEVREREGYTEDEPVIAHIIV